uniref:hypothetical protein n=1 Tax=Neisseria sicca TaxID=490 RepID=UPI001C998467
WGVGDERRMWVVGKEEGKVGGLEGEGGLGFGVEKLDVGVLVVGERVFERRCVYKKEGEG